MNLEEFSKWVGVSLEQAKVFMELGNGDSEKAIALYSKVSHRTFRAFEIIAQTYRVNLSRRSEIQTLFSVETGVTNYQGTIVTFYTNGFTINHGALRDFHEPQNRQFIEELQEGMVRGICPTEFISETANENNEIKIRIERKNSPWNPFLIPQKHCTSKPLISRDLFLQFGIWVQDALPMTKLKIGLPEYDVNLVVVCNLTSTVGEILSALALPLQENPTNLSLVSTHCRNVFYWESESKTIQDAGLSFAHVFLQVKSNKTSQGISHLKNKKE